MIKVQIKETGAIETLSIVGANGTDFTADMIGNHGGFSDDQFKRIEGTDLYSADQDTYDWWEKVLAENQALDERINALNEEHGSDAVHEVIQASGNYELEDHAAALNAALDEAFGE